MSIEDPGWGGFVEEEPAPSQPPPPATSPGPPAPPSPRRTRTIVVALVAVIVVAGAGTGVALTLSSKTSSTTTTTTTAASTTNTGNTGGGEPSLISVVPSALSGTCSATASSERVAAQVIDEIGCDAESVSGSSADFIGYARFASASAVSGYFSALLSSNSLTAGQGDCASVTLGGATSNGSYCEGSYTDSAGNSGEDVAFLGQSFDVGGSAGSTTAFCQANFPGSSGVSVVAWTSPGDDSVGFAVDCTASASSFVAGMLSNLVHGDYLLND
jgi:hypothetical protein